MRHRVCDRPHGAMQRFDLIVFGGGAAGLVTEAGGDCLRRVPAAERTDEFGPRFAMPR